MSKPLTPDGQGIVVDEVTDKDGKKFYTITTPDENVFYLVIDEERDSDNVYFLNDVTESEPMSVSYGENVFASTDISGLESKKLY